MKRSNGWNMFDLCGEYINEQQENNLEQLLALSGIECIVLMRKT